MSLIERSRSGSVLFIAAFFGLQAAGAGPVGRNDEPPAASPNAKKGAQAPAPAPPGPKSQAPSPRPVLAPDSDAQVLVPAAADTVRVRLAPRPLALQYGSTLRVTAQGWPAVNGSYLNWTVQNGNFDVRVGFDDQPACPDRSSCANAIVAEGLTLGNPGPPLKTCGTAQAVVSFESATGGGRATDLVPLELGCGGRSASECTSVCNSERTQGMCGTTCDMLGVTPPPFNAATGACWVANVNGTDYCYWDHKDASGSGFENLCCPNRCYGASFTVWGQGTGQFVCTVVEKCDANPQLLQAIANGSCPRVNI
jgi:hypothetical protein